jgi:2-methylisocitrate lyase-like PEP mutase family enzyme
VTQSVIMIRPLSALALLITTVTGVLRTRIGIMMDSVSATKTGAAMTASVMMANVTHTVKAVKAPNRTIARNALSTRAGADLILIVNVTMTGLVMTVATGLVPASLLAMAVLAQRETTAMTAYYTLNGTEL